jgi:hypothetical protein
LETKRSKSTQRLIPWVPQQSQVRILEKWMCVENKDKILCVSQENIFHAIQFISYEIICCVIQCSRLGNGLKN